MKYGKELVSLPENKNWFFSRLKKKYIKKHVYSEKKKSVDKKFIRELYAILKFWNYLNKFL
jgi:hypothetical protein